MLQNNIVGLSAEGAARVGSGTNLKQAIRRKRKRDEVYPREPRTAHDLIIPERFRVTDAEQNFVLYDSKDENEDEEGENEDRLIILGTEDSLNRLREVCPTIFLQLFTLHFMFRSTVVPALYAPVFPLNGIFPVFRQIWVSGKNGTGSQTVVDQGRDVGEVQNM